MAGSRGQQRAAASLDPIVQFLAVNLHELHPSTGKCVCVCTRVRLYCVSVHVRVEAMR